MFRFVLEGIMKTLAILLVFAVFAVSLGIPEGHFQYDLMDDDNTPVEREEGAQEKLPVKEGALETRIIYCPCWWCGCPWGQCRWEEC